MRILQRELALPSGDVGDADAWLECLRRLRVLIVHAGGDSKRLPAYGPCGKIFIPVPGPSDSAVGTTLFDRQIRTFLALSPGGAGEGQFVITAGDVLLGFDPSLTAFGSSGVTGLAARATPAEGPAGADADVP